MQAVILAAGEGTRMRPLTENTPKPMLPVADRPLVAHTADTAIDAGADELIFVVGYEADAVREYFGDSYGGVPVQFAVQAEQLGTADAVNAASEYLDGPFAVLNGDNLYDEQSLTDLFDAAPSIAAYRVPDPSNYGVLSTDGDTVTAIVEKPDDPPTELANAGAYAFPAVASEWLDVPMSDRGEREITDVVARVIEEHGVTAVEVEPAPVLANVASNAAYAGSKAELQGPCPYTECPSHDLCEPAGAEFDTEYQIAEVVGEPPHDHCMLDRELTLVEFAPEGE